MIYIILQDPEEFMKEDEEPTPEPVKPKAEKKVTIDAPAATAGDDGFTSVGKGGKAAEVDDKPILVRLREVLESRGKKVTRQKTVIGPHLE
jgi:translation initiation factor 3 subunit C